MLIEMVSNILQLNFLIAFIVLFFGFLQGSEITKLDLDEYERFVQHIVDCRGVTGLSVTLIKDNQLLWSRGFGHANIEEGIPATNDTKFSVGSLTKAFTTTILAKILHDHPRYTWDTPLRDILGKDFRLIDGYRTQHVNIRDLVAHKVGVPGYFNTLVVGCPANLSRAEFARLLECQPASVPLRTKFLYSNHMFTLAGHVAERITGRTWEDLVQDFLMTPLGMTRSGFVDKVPHFDQSFADCYSYIKGQPVKIAEELLYSVSPLGPAGSIFSTGNDISKWMIFHLSGGKTEGNETLISGELLKQTYHNEMVNPFPNSESFQPMFPITDALVAYDLGWATSVYRDYKRIWHSGGIVEFSSLMWLFPDVHSGIFVSMSGSKGNKNGQPIKVIMSRAADLLLGLEPWVNDTTGCSYPEPWLPVDEQVPVDYNTPETNWNISEPMSSYIGTYGHPSFLTMSVSHENNNLLIKYGRFGKLVLTPIDKYNFKARYIELLSYVTQSDNAQPPLNVTFEFSSGTGGPVKLSYPVDYEHSVMFVKDYQPSTSNYNCDINISSPNMGFVVSTNCILIFILHVTSISAVYGSLFIL